MASPEHKIFTKEFSRITNTEIWNPENLIKIDKLPKAHCTCSALINGWMPQGYLPVDKGCYL